LAQLGLLVLVFGSVASLDIPDYPAFIYSALLPWLVQQHIGFVGLSLSRQLRSFAPAKFFSHYTDSCKHDFNLEATGLEGFSNAVLHNDVDDLGLLKLYQSADILFLPLLKATANNALLLVACLSSLPGFPRSKHTFPALKPS